MVPRYKRLPPRVLEPEHLWGFLGTLVLNVIVWAPYLVIAALAAALLLFDGPFTDDPHPLAAPPDADAPVVVPR